MKYFLEFDSFGEKNFEDAATFQIHEKMKLTCSVNQKNIYAGHTVSNKVILKNFGY